MIRAKPGWSALKSVVTEALDLPPDARAAHLVAQCQDPAQRAEATRLLRACEQAAASPVFELSAAEFAAPVLAEVHEGEQGAPEVLRTALAGRYTIDRELGRGGMATVYLARDERHGRLVALKLLRPELVPESSPTRSAERFQREIEFAARLSHPHILPLYDSGAAGGLLYYITPYVDGETLRERLRRAGRPSLDESLRLLRHVARALAYAHRQGVVHRDIKPANILLNQEGDALVADFGVARGLAAAQGTAATPETGRPIGASVIQGPMAPLEAELTDGTLVLGTPAYMAPEQVTGGSGIDHRADLYAFGAVAYELLTGAAPFAGRPRHEQLAAHLSEVPEPVAHRHPGVPEALATLVDRLLAKHPDDRPRDAAEVVQLLDAALAGPALAVQEAGEASSSEGGTEDREAYEMYRKGRYLVGTRQRESLVRALTYFEAAAARDSTYARAHAGMADVWTFLGIFGHATPQDAFPRARAAAERAISLDSQLVEGHAALAHLLFVYEWNWRAAEIALMRTIALNPLYPLVRMYYASFLTSVDRPEEALAQLTIAKELDPLIQTGLLSGRVYVTTHRPDEAIRVLEEEIELDPRRDLAHQLLAHAYLQRGMAEEAIASMKRAAALSGARDSAQLAYIYARTGHHAEARRLLARLKESGQLLDHLGYHVAMAYAGLGDSDEAFRWLEAAYEHHSGFMCLLAVETGFESLSSDPRFDDLLQRMGLRQIVDPAVGLRLW